jgi:hypothetical protein
MQDQTPKLKLTYPQVCIFMGWFLFQERNNIHVEHTSLSRREIKFSNKLNTAATKMKETAKGCYIFVTSEEAKIAHDWFNHLPGSLMDNKDRQMYDCLKVFVHENS